MSLWRINDDFDSLLIQGLIKRNNSEKVACFMARFQTKSDNDRMNDLSPKFTLIISKNLTDNCPWCWLPKCNDAACLKLKDISRKLSIFFHNSEIAAGHNFGV
ncbi:hypothetical protein DPMN_116441 [Dreissena polymorpha]|uniref:Uncharacterized protein n=1 Tax=Dreissena polymorpha TaxID=45954 RepID=A0A9D4KNP9_DREPO|nr:hypothetical protein DPMN_116441 [Dreissena polymorpha]